MRNWRDIDWRLSQRTERERRTVFAGVLLGVPLALWLLIWEPLLSWRAAEQERYLSKQQTLEWMQAAAARIEAYRAAGRDAEAAVSGSPEQLITRGAASLGLTVSRIEPSGDRRFNVFFSAVPYADFIRFIDQLQRQGLLIDSLTMGQLPEPGQVSVRLTLEAGR